MEKVLGLRLRTGVPNLRGETLPHSVLANAEELVTFIKQREHSEEEVDLLGRALLRTRDGRERQVYLFYVPGCEQVDSYLGIMPV